MDQGVFRRRHDYRQPQRLPTVPAFVPIPGGGLVRPKRVFLDMYVRPWDYTRGSGRNKVFRPMLPGVVTPPPPPSEVSRGIYAGPRGLYHEERSSAAEPYCAANTQNAQVIPTATPTLLNIVGALSFAGTFDEDPWGMIDVANDRIVFTHEGWYSVTVAVGSFAATAGTEILLHMRVYNAAGLVLRDVIKSNRVTPGSEINSFHLSTLEPFVRGYYLQTYVTQSSGVNKTAGPFRIYLARVATNTKVVPR